MFNKYNLKKTRLKSKQFANLKAMTYKDLAKIMLLLLIQYTHTYMQTYIIITKQSVIHL